MCKMKKISLWTNNGVEVEENHVWFVPFELNILCKYNVEQENIEEYFILEDWECDKAAVYNTAIWEDSVVTIPGRGRSLCIIKGDGKEEIHVVSKKEDKSEKFFCTVKTKKALYILPLEEKYVIKYSSGKIEKIPFFHGSVISACCHDKDIYFITNQNTLFKANEDFTEITEVEMEGIESVCYVNVFGDRMVLLTSAGKMMNLDLNYKDNINELACLDEDDYWASCCCIGNKIIMFPYKDFSKIWRYDCDYETVDFICIKKDEYFYEEWSFNAFGQPVEDGENIYVMSPKHRTLFVLDYEGELKGRYRITLSMKEKDMLTLLDKKMAKVLAVEENQFHSLNTLIEYLNTKQT